MIGLSERGYLLPGMIADLTLFDPETIADEATIDAPTLPSVGIRDVVINGRFALRDGKLTDVPAGLHLIRSRHEPSRPMSFDVDRSLRVQGSVAGSVTKLAIDLRQRANGPRPEGHVRVSGLPGGVGLAMSPSILQATDKWASVTGIARGRDGRESAVTIVVEQADPFADRRPSVLVLVDGATVAEGALPAGTVAVLLRR